MPVPLAPRITAWRRMSAKGQIRLPPAPIGSARSPARRRPNTAPAGTIGIGLGDLLLARPNITLPPAGDEPPVSASGPRPAPASAIGTGRARRSRAPRRSGCCVRRRCGGSRGCLLGESSASIAWRSPPISKTASGRWSSGSRWRKTVRSQTQRPSGARSARCRRTSLIARRWASIATSGAEATNPVPASRAPRAFSQNQGMSLTRKAAVADAAGVLQALHQRHRPLQWATQEARQLIERDRHLLGEQPQRRDLHSAQLGAGVSHNRRPAPAPVPVGQVRLGVHGRTIARSACHKWESCAPRRIQRRGWVGPRHLRCARRRSAFVADFSDRE